MALPNEPITRQEMYLSNIAGQNTALPDAPITREEMYLDYIAKTGGTGEGDMKKSVYDSDNSVASAGGIKMFVNQKIGTIPQKVGTLETKVSVLEGEVASIENNLGNLGTASTKNSTSVVTESTDLVESGAVFDAIQAQEQLLEDTVGWTGKNLLHLTLDYIKLRNVEGSWSGNVYVKNGVTYTVNTDENDNVTDIQTSGTATANTYFTLLGDYYTGRVPIEHLFEIGKTYTLSSGSSFTDDKRVSIYIYDEDGKNVVNTHDKSFTVPPTAKYFGIFIYITNNTTPNMTFYPQIEKGSTATAYEPYHASVEDYCASKQDVINTVGWCSTVIDKGVLASANVNSEGVINNSSYSLAYFKVQAGKKYTVSNCNDFTDVNLILAYFTEKPVQQAVSYNNSRTQIVRGTAISQTVTAPIDGYIVIRMNNSTDNIRFEVGEVVTQSVEDKKCDNSVIATVENNSTTSQAYAVGSHAIRNGAFITWKNAKAQGETINDASDYTSGDVVGCLIKRDTYSGTTSPNGNIALYHGTDRAIVAVYNTFESDTLCTVFKGSNDIWGRFITALGEVKANTYVGGTYYYYDI